MRNRTTKMTAILLVMAIGAYYAVVYDGSIRLVEYISVGAVGVLLGVLLTQLFSQPKA